MYQFWDCVQYYHKDCVLGDWERETNCSKSCGEGTLTVKRRVIKNNTGHGLACPGDTTRLDTCNDFICPGLLAVIVIFPLLLILSAAISIIIGLKWKYNEQNIQTVSFNSPNRVIISNENFLSL